MVLHPSLQDFLRLAIFLVHNIEIGKSPETDVVVRAYLISLIKGILCILNSSLANVEQPQILKIQKLGI